VFTCFAVALREGWTRDARRDVGPGTGLQASTVRAALDGVVQTYRAHQFGSPIHDARGRIEPVLAAQLKGYSFDNPEVRQAPAIHARVVAIVASATGSELHLAMGQLTVGAFFFAMRACEYSETNGRSRTRTVTIGDVEFRKGSQTISSMDEQCLSEADTVSVTYRTQKNGDRGTTVTQYRAENHRGLGLCPVRALAKLKARVMAFNVIDPRWPSADNRPINLLVVTMDASASPPKGSGCVVRGSKAGLSCCQTRNPLAEIRCRNGHVPGMSASGNDTTDRALEESGVPPLHTSPSIAIHRGRCDRNDDKPGVLHDQKSGSESGAPRG
jgi:hypothetical protein